MTFAKGQSGNPAGRKPGTLTKQGKMRAQIAEAVPGILKAMQEKAAAGDVMAARLLLDRVLPSLKSVDTPTPLALGNAPADLGGAATAVLVALAGGGLSPEQAGSVAGVLAALARAKETAELIERIERLERGTAGGSTTP